MDYQMGQCQHPQVECRKGQVLILVCPEDHGRQHRYLLSLKGFSRQDGGHDPQLAAVRSAHRAAIKRLKGVS